MLFSLVQLLYYCLLSDPLYFELSFSYKLSLVFILERKFSLLILLYNDDD